MYKKIILLVVVIVVVLMLISYVKMMMLYHPVPAIPEKYDKFYQRLSQLAAMPKNVSNFFVQTEDGVYLDTIHITNPNTSKCILFFHGNAGNLSMRYDMIKFLYNYASVIIFDYRSFGKSSGSHIFLNNKGLQKDAEAIWNHTVNTLNVNPNDISLFGESLGCSVAINLAANLSKTFDQKLYPHSLILNAPFSSLSSMIELTFQKVNIGFIGKLISYIFGREYQSNELISFINHQTKIIIAHSPRDEIIPYIEGKKLYDFLAKTHQNIQFVNITGTHNNLGLTDQYIYILADLFNE